MKDKSGSMRCQVSMSEYDCMQIQYKYVFGDLDLIV